jgi:hypothetical protein
MLQAIIGLFVSTIYTFTIHPLLGIVTFIGGTIFLAYKISILKLAGIISYSLLFGDLKLVGYLVLFV